MNDDASVRRLKGDKRPLRAQEERARVLAALGCVDFVVMFREDTPLALIKALRPDVLAKGGDYTLETVVARPLAPVKLEPSTSYPILRALQLLHSWTGCYSVSVEAPGEFEQGVLP